MIKTSIEKLAESIGFDIGNSDDVVQADLLNGFCKGLTNSMNDHSLEKQLCYLAERLTPKTEKVIRILLDFIELKHKEQ